MIYKWIMYLFSIWSIFVVWISIRLFESGLSTFIKLLSEGKTYVRFACVCWQACHVALIFGWTLFLDDSHSGGTWVLFGKSGIKFMITRYPLIQAKYFSFLLLRNCRICFPFLSIVYNQIFIIKSIFIKFI